MTDKKQQNKQSTLQTVMYLVFSLVCALLIWVYVTESTGIETDRPFPGVSVVYEGENSMRESRGLIISERGATSARVTLSGNRRTISALDQADLRVVIDLNDINSTGNYSRAPKVEYAKKIPAQSRRLSSIPRSSASTLISSASIRSL